MFFIKLLRKYSTTALRGTTVRLGDIFIDGRSPLFKAALAAEELPQRPISINWAGVKYGLLTKKLSNSWTKNSIDVDNVTLRRL